MATPSESSLSKKGCHWFDVGFSPDVFIPDVVLLGLASSPSHQSHLSGAAISRLIIFIIRLLNDICVLGDVPHF